MLLQSGQLLNRQVLSLQLGRELGFTTDFIINPNNLQIIAFAVVGPNLGTGENQLGNLLDYSSVREFSDLGFIIDSGDELIRRGDVARLDKIIDLNFKLIGLKVVTKKGSKLGKVEDFTVNSDNLMIQQLIIKRPTIKSFLDPELTIGRSQIVEVTDFEVIVKDEAATIGSTAEDFMPNFVNPFRKQKEAMSQKDQN